jgi:tetratricopeptide (TPR) repeat protein
LESNLSAQFNKCPLRSLALLGVAVVLSACSAGGSPRPESAASAVAPVQQAPEPSRQARRAARDAAKANAEAAQQTDSATREPAAMAPERALQAYERALAAMRAEDWIEAELELEQLVLEYPGFAGPYVNLAIVYMRDDRKDDASEALERALAIDPAHVAANNQFAILLREQGRFEEAEQAYRRALQSDPSYALAYYNLGVLLDLYLGRQSEALEYYEQYQSLLEEPDQQVGRWIVDLRRRLGVNDNSRVAQGSGA